MKQVIYKGIPLASATITVAVPEPFRLSVSADPSWGKKIFLEEKSGGPGMGDQGLTRDQAAELAQRLVQAGIILDDIELRDEPEPKTTPTGIVPKPGGGPDDFVAGRRDGEVQRLDALDQGLSNEEPEEGRPHGEPMCANPKMVDDRCATCGLVSSLPVVKNYADENTNTEDEGDDHGE